MFHYSEQWNVKEERNALINLESCFVGKRKISKKPSFKELYEKGASIRRVRWCRGVDAIDNYNGFSEFEHSIEYRAYHYFDTEYQMWCTEYYVIKHL